MKKARLLVAMLVMMVAASGFAQGSYRETVKDYLALNDQFEKTKSLLSTLNMIFEKNDLVDIDQLSNRYISERLEDDLVDNTMPKLIAQGLTDLSGPPARMVSGIPYPNVYEYDIARH